MFVLPAELVRDQMHAALETCPVAAVKIGMLATRATVETVADCLSRLSDIPIVLDPVLAASSGAFLLDEPGREALLGLLLPRATLVTPNIPEAAALIGEPEAANEGEMLDHARRLQALGAGAVLIKGGHGHGDEAVDLLMRDGGGPIRIAGPRLAVTMRGTGCALSTAIAVYMARGESLAEACHGAQGYVSAQLRIGLAVPSSEPINDGSFGARMVSSGESGTR